MTKTARVIHGFFAKVETDLLQGDFAAKVQAPRERIATEILDLMSGS